MTAGGPLRLRSPPPPLTCRPLPPLFPRQPAGRPLRRAQALRPSGAVEESPGSKGSTVAANGRRGRPQGKCHREPDRPSGATRKGKGETVR